MIEKVYLTKSTSPIKVGHRINLALISQDDTCSLYKLVKHHKSYMREWLPWVDYISSKNDFRQLIYYYQNKFHSMGIATMSIHINNTPAGIIGFNYIDWTNLIGGIGYWLGESYQGKGHMSQACKAILNHGFEELNLHKINILCAEKNYRSQNIPKKLNFKVEGLIRQAEWVNDHYNNLLSYSMLKKDWKTSQESFL